MNPRAPQAEWQDLLEVHQGLADRAHPISPARSMADGGAGGQYRKAGQHCGDLDIGPTVVLLGQGLMALEGKIGSWTMGRLEGALGVRQGQASLWEPSRP